MYTRTIAVIALGAIACAGSQRTPLSRAGDERDDGAGDLALASLKLQTPADTEPRGFVDQRATRAYDYGAAYGGDPYGGNGYGGGGGGGFGGDPYGGAGYANWRMPQWSYN